MEVVPKSTVEVQISEVQIVDNVVLISIFIYMTTGSLFHSWKIVSTSLFDPLLLQHW
jgi:hypothetical protein